MPKWSMRAHLLRLSLFANSGNFMSHTCPAGQVVHRSSLA